MSARPFAGPGWLVLAPLVLGAALTLYVANELERRAVEQFESSVSEAGRVASERLLNLVDAAADPLLDIGILFANDLERAQRYFHRTLDLLESRDQDFVPIGAAILLGDDDGERVEMSTDAVGPLVVGNRFARDSEVAQLVALARERRGQPLLGRLGERTQFSGLAFMALQPVGSDGAVLLQSVDIVELMRGIHGLRRPEGLFLRVGLRNAVAGRGTPMRSLYDDELGENSAAARGSLEQFALGADFRVEWAATSQFAGGPDLTASRVALGAGALVTLLASALAAFLVSQYRRIEARVHAAVAESERNRGELEIALEDAQAAARTKATFLATMSHEIRTPLNGVVGIADLLTETPLDVEQRDMLGTLRESSLSLLTIINDILDFSKIEAGKLDIEEVPLSLTDMVESAVQALAPVADAKGVRMTAFASPSLPPVMGDATRLRQVLFNLAGNAVKFTEHGRVIVRADLMEQRDDGRARVRFEVSDTGIGISKEAQARLFQAFTQAEGSTTRRYGGTGLGLSICRRLVELMSGHIDVESAPGKGSTFTFELLLASAPDLDEEPPPDVAGRTLLLVEPSAEFAGFALNYLGVARVRAEACETAEAAIGAAGPFDVVALGPTLGETDLRALAVAKSTRAAGWIVPRALADAAKATLGHARYVVVDLVPLRRRRLLRAIDRATGGADFTVEPLTPSATPPAPVAASTRVLVAEDNKVNQLVIGRQLKQLGVEFEVVDDGQQALDALESRPFDLLLTDCHMPVMDGFELVTRIRAAEGDRNERLPVIAVTASAMSEEVKRCYSVGMDNVVTKPIAIEALSKAIDVALGADAPVGETRLL